MNVADFTSMLIRALNESTPPTHFTSASLTDSIRLSRVALFNLINDGAQSQIEVTADGSSKLPISVDLLNVVRLDQYDGCGLPLATIDQATKLLPGWRGCSFVAEETPTHYVLDPDSPTDVWLIPAPENGKKVTLTVNRLVDTDDLPDRFLVPLRHFALSYAYERLYGANDSSSVHLNKAYKWVAAYLGKTADG